ncbi:uncharacterized protein LOC114280307 [Camellia sinensis]|uniref:uncharacterized protein LOC114280307 n=1 Tax=Camellia sinensis TaxID=4442 RepID=UPI0010364375|nr:uncharacterized protein LOC114280307 [Camellia sinensis]
MLNGWAGFKCLKKLQALKATLKQWNNDVFGNVEFKLKQVEEELHALDLLAKERALSSSQAARRREAKGEAWKMSKMVEWVWLQKSRLNWANKGDKNMKPGLLGPFKTIGEDQISDFLELDFSETKILATVRNCEGNKAAGPDRFNLTMFQKCWSIIKADVLSNRLKKVMPRIISDSQSAFIEGKNILDGILIANEIVDGWKKDREKRCGGLKNV